MRRLLIALVLGAGITGSALLAYSQDAQDMERTTTRGSVNDETKFLTIKDEYGNEHFIKTIALVKLHEDGLKLEMGKAISPTQDEPGIPEDKSILFE